MYSSKAGSNYFSEKSYWVIKDAGILDTKNKLQTISLIGVQGDCEYIYTFLW